MSFLLDTNICSAHLKQRSGLIHRFVQHGGSLYVMIAATAQVYDLTLVTHNTKHFQTVPGLRVVDWLEP